MPRLHRFFVNKTPEAAADLAQQTFLAVLESDRYQPGRSFRAYLLGIAHNVLYKHVRKRTRGINAVNRVLSKTLDPTPSQVFARRWEFGLMLEALRNVPLEQQIILELFYWEEMSHQEIGEVLDLKVGTVKSRLSRARAKLKERMLELAGDSESGHRTVDSFDRWAEGLRETVAT